MRTIVIGDCHGRPDLIVNAVENSGFVWAFDRLVFAGDFLDIGSEPKRCLLLLESLDATILFGNHEYAILLQRLVHPQDAVSWNFRDLILDRFRIGEWQLAAEVDGVLISHAGFSQVYESEYLGVGASTSEFVAHINGSFHEKTKESLALMDVPGSPRVNEDKPNEFESPEGPLWYRPGFLMPLPGVTQVVGHTPPEIVKEKYDGFNFIDPYARRIEHEGGFEKRYRYAVIEDGVVTVHDSLEDREAQYGWV